MSVMNSPGVYPRIVDKSFVVNAGGILAGAMVVTSDRGPTDVRVITSSTQLEELYGLPNRDNPSLFSAFRYMARANLLSIIRVIHDAETATGQTTDGMFSFESANPGEWGNNISVTFEEATDEGAGFFNVIVHEDGEEVERFLVSRDPEAKDGFGNSVFIEDRINGNSRFVTVEDDVSIDTAIDFSDTVELSGGSNDTEAVDTADIVSAWSEFLNPDQIPASMLINAGFAAPAVQTKMEAVAASRKDSIAILDVPKDDSDDLQQVLTYNDTLGINSNRAALYAGWLRAFNQYTRREELIPPSADVAAIINYTAETADRWYAPAGLQRGIIPNAMGVSKVWTRGDMDMLYTNNINPVTSYAGANAIVWGQKNLQKQASSLDRVSNVMMVLWMNGRMKEALYPFVFEPNTADTRQNVTFIISSFLDNIQQRGGLYGFRVVCDESNNTPFVLDNNQMIVDVHVQLVAHAEFIRLSTIVHNRGVDLV